MSSHQLDNSGLNRISTWNVQPFKDFANASWHRWSVQPLGIKALVGFSGVVVLGIISIIVRKALSSETRSTSTSNKKTDGASSKPAASPTASQGASTSEKAQPASGTAAVSESGKKESEKTKWVDVLPNQVSQVPFRSLHGNCINEQYDPEFPPYAQGVYSFKPQGILRNKKISNDKKIEVSFYHKEGEVLYSESVSCDVEKYAIPLRNLPYERDIVVKFTVDGKEIHRDMFNVDQIRGAYTIKCASQKLHEHEFPNRARPGNFDVPNLQGGVPGWNIDTPVSFILDGTKIQKSNSQLEKGHYYLDNKTDFVQVVIFELGIEVDPASPVVTFVSFSVAVLPKSSRTISKEDLIESVEKATKKALPAGAKIGVSSIQQIVYSKS